MEDIQLDQITTDRIQLSELDGKDIEISLLRLDKIHPLISGNKWFKLRYYLDEFNLQKKKKIITFGGAWSNHILATAAACHLYKIPCIGIIRGEKPKTKSVILQKAAELGMELIYISRQDYAKNFIPNEIAVNENLIIPAGGYGEPGKNGAATILNYCPEDNSFTHICCATGTGTMLAGLTESAGLSKKIIGISVLKNNFTIADDVQRLTGTTSHPFSVFHEYHFGGFAKYTPHLINYMNHWYTQTNIPLDFVYTAKLCYAVTDLVRKDYFPAGSRILLIHSGGLAGNASLAKGMLIY